MRKAEQMADAVILAERGQVEESAGVAATMLDKARGMESRRVRDRLMTVVTAIRAHGATMATQELAERVRDQFSVPL